ncbi:Oidioi.mRNA.OKI2018_I69.PAR.g9939.t1.cds [Oikopleura dioica]|uniref:Oidioi.mRNA.OKI2018_I69.PAR.g9939.t1.cds n=1 Tax=Oikopleura dioica TaxID=34765 RepID=A0ABN7RN23_OIKDI|nr:Oidioi.mRNA.OKI2018_I69.PAR.g9939.t1.cds [Oikopleura dioica]
MTLRKSLRYPCRIVIFLSFIVIFIDWGLLLRFSDEQNPCTDETNLTLFGAGCLFGYVPILTSVAILKQHMARKGLLLASAVSSVILSIYDFSQSSQLKCNVALGVLLILQGAAAGVIVILSGYMWFFLGRPGERLSPEEENSPEVTGQNDLPPDYDRAVRAESHIIYRVQTKWESLVFRLKQRICYETLRTPLVVSGANLDRIMVGISTTTICIVVMQIGQAAFNNKPLSPNTHRGNTLLVSAEALTSLQSLMSIAGAALAMVAFYVMANNLYLKLERHSADTQNSSAQNSNTRRRTSSDALSPEDVETQETIVGIDNEAFTQEEHDSKLPSYDMARGMGRRRQSLPDLSKRSKYLQLPGTSQTRPSIRRSNSFNLEERGIDEPPPYRT